MSKSPLQWIKDTKLVPVLRADSAEEAIELARLIYAGGVDVMEVTTTVPDAANVLRRLHLEFGERMLLGAGTVTTVQECEALLAAGAAFVVSPSLHREVITTTKAAGQLMISGALTPTEIITAFRTGADVVKIFPCSAMGGADYLKSIRAPFPQIPLIPTGGVTLATARNFLDAGAIALGVGSDLVDVKGFRSGNGAGITETARQYVSICKGDLG
jgi:2-dehydro-3-deoxyphosphogluconate aldolase/(4S)-4-hydroxy-2-oxoglutarate aldolase